MKIIIDVDNALTEREDLDLFIKEFKKQLGTGCEKGRFECGTLLNFKWRFTR